MKKSSCLQWRSSMLLLLSGSCLANSVDVDSLIEMPLESLMKMNIAVTSTSKREQRSFDAPAAVFVITAEDIQRMGISSVPDALRMVPGVQVGQVSSSEWAVGIRGLGGVFSQHLQVLVNGRSIYNNLFSSVLWDEVNFAMQDIERIEVQRGPGASVWGANAVNGVINIVTKTPSLDDGNLLTAQIGDYEEGAFYLRTNQAAGEHIRWRLSGNTQRRDGLENSAETLEEGNASSERLAFALVHQRNGAELTANIDVFQVENNAYFPDTRDSAVALSGGTSVFQNKEDKNGYAIQFGYSYPVTDNQTARVRFSFDDIERDSYFYIWEDRNIDLDIEYVAELKNQYLTLGINNRFNDTSIYEGSRSQFTLDPAEDEIKVSSLFVHDTISLSENWQVDIGVRYEDQSEAGDNVQGTLRGLWKINPQQRLWAALSKADSTPSRLSSSTTDAAIFVFPDTPPATLSVISNGNNLDNTELRAAELGYKHQFSTTLTLEATAFYNEYSNTLSSSLVGINLIEPISGYPLVDVEAALGDDRDLESTGFELTVNWQYAAGWNLQYSGSYLNFKDELVNSIGGVTATPPTFYMSIDSPQQQHSLRLLGELNARWSVGFWLRYMDELALVQVDDYLEMDAKFTYQPSKTVALSLIGKNLFDDRHLEGSRGFYYVDNFEVERSVAAELEWRF